MRDLQEALNVFTNRYVDGVAPLHVDGHSGPLTNARIKLVKRFLGYVGPPNSKTPESFRSRMWHPRSVRYSSPARIARGMARRSAQRAEFRKLKQEAAKDPKSLTTFDGHPVFRYFVPHLQYARDHGWRGVLTSGYRTPAYSESLCYRMCGRPACPGTCAGRNSNHVRGAIDVSDYQTFARLMRSSPHQPRIFNALANDKVHFSPNGH